MENVLIRYGEIGTKSEPVRSRMADVLRQRVVDRLEYEDLGFKKVSRKGGRIIVKTDRPVRVAETVSELPGVSSASPARKTEAEIKKMKEVVKKADVGSSFGVKTNRAGEHNFDSREVNEELGSFIEEEKGAFVDLDDPDTWVELDIRFENAYVFTKRFEGPDGFPVGSEGGFLSLISGGIDSPVAAYKVMSRGSDMTPIYFYNKPLVAEDHFMRFKSIVEKLKKFHPSKKWHIYSVDMEEVNKALMEVGRGRMIIHRKVMFRVAEKIADREGLNGIVTGESLGQKSSQTPSNLQKTSSYVDIPVHRPLLTWDKNEITDKAREIGTLENSDVDSGCRDLAPDSPATSIKERDLLEVERDVGIEELVEKAISNAEKLRI